MIRETGSEHTIEDIDIFLLKVEQQMTDQRHLAGMINTLQAFRVNHEPLADWMFSDQLEDDNLKKNMPSNSGALRSTNKVQLVPYQTAQKPFYETKDQFSRGNIMSLKYCQDL